MKNELHIYAYNATKMKREKNVQVRKLEADYKKDIFAQKSQY